MTTTLFDDLPVQNAPVQHPKVRVAWEAIGLKITKVKTIINKDDRAAWDIAWVHGELHGKPVRVDVPFTYVPSDFLVRRKYLFNAGNEYGVTITRIGLLENGVFSSKH